MKTFSLFAITILLVIAAIITLRYLGLEDRVLALLAYVKDAGVPGQILFSLAIAASVLLLLPSVVLTVGAGFVYGTIHGSLLVVAAETVGASVAFLVARHVLGQTSGAWLKERARLLHVSSAILSRGWRVIALFRIIPFFPFKLSNYMFGLVPISFKNYFIGTLVGLWPITLFNVYLGSIAADMVSLSGATRLRTPLQWTAVVAGFSVTVIALVYLTKVAQKTLADYDADKNTRY